MVALGNWLDKKMSYAMKEALILNTLKKRWWRKYHDPITGERNNDWLSFEEYQKTDIL